MVEKLSKIEKSLSIATGLAGAGLTALCLSEPSLTLPVIEGSLAVGTLTGAVSCPSVIGPLAGAVLGGMSVGLTDCVCVGLTAVTTGDYALGGALAAGAGAICATIPMAIVYSKSFSKFYRNAIGTALISSAILYGRHELTEKNYSQSAIQTNSLSSPKGFETFTEREKKTLEAIE